MLTTIFLLCPSSDGEEELMPYAGVGVLGVEGTIDAVHHQST
jgi:hypothetical protein